jgi:two-component system, NarL family, nitrate/nitrite response regulator NarL
VIRVLIEASSRVARAGLQALLEEMGGLEIVSDVKDAEVIVRDSEARPLPYGRGSRSEVAAPVVLLSDEPLTARSFQAGVRAVLAHDAEPAQILAAIQATAAGLVAVTMGLAPVLIAADATQTEAEPLTGRELEVLDMLAEGLSNKQIGGRLGISEHTAKFHVNAILAKLRAGTRTEAVTRAIRLGILKI